MTIDMFDPVDLAPIKALLVAVPPGVVQPDGLAFTRLNAEGGPVHTGGPDGIVYSACKVAYWSAPEAADPILALLTAAPAALVALVADLEREREANAIIRNLSRELAAERDRIFLDFKRLRASVGLPDLKPVYSLRGRLVYDDPPPSPSF